MDIRKRWTVWLKNGIESLGNVASPAIDLYTLWVYSIPEGKVLFQHTFDSGFVINVFAEEGIVLTYDWNKKDGYQLTCWEITT